MKTLSTEETLLATIPILLIVIGLFAAMVLFPKNNTNTDIRGRASEPTPSVAINKIDKPASIEIVCSQLYSPVCGSDQVTYHNECEAQLEGVSIAHQGKCKPVSPDKARTPLVLPSGSE